MFNKALFRCQGVRRTGSASLNLCDVAAGRFGVLWGFSTKIWDIAAGVLLIREAGGVVTSPEGGQVNLGLGAFSGLGEPGFASAIAGIGAGSRLSHLYSAKAFLAIGPAPPITAIAPTGNGTRGRGPSG